MVPGVDAFPGALATGAGSLNRMLLKGRAAIVLTVRGRSEAAGDRLGVVVSHLVGAQIPAAAGSVVPHDERLAEMTEASPNR
jgi:hypothetical protein